MMGSSGLISAADTLETEDPVSVANSSSMHLIYFQQLKLYLTYQIQAYLKIRKQ